MAIDFSTVYLSFEILPSKDCKSLLIIDKSNYAHMINEQVLIDILLPGYTEPVTHVFQKNKVNIFNASNLNLQDAETPEDLLNLPDGIYTISLRMCPYETFNSVVLHLQNCRQKCDYTSKLIGIDLFCNCYDNKKFNKLQESKFLMELSEAYIAKCLPDKAKEAYQRASKILDGLDC